MAAGIRPNMKLAKIAYKLLKTPKDQQQNGSKPNKKMKLQWIKDSTQARGL